MNNLDRSQAPAVYNLPTMHIPAPRTFTLDNGIEVNILDAGTEEVNCITALLQGGTAEAPRGFIAQLQAALLREGTASTDSATLADILDFNGSWWKGVAHNHYLGATMYSLNNKLPHTLPLFVEMLQAPRMGEEEAAVVKESMACSMEVEQAKVAFHAQQASERAMLGATSPLITNWEPDDIRNIDTAEVRRLYHDNMATTGMAVYISGRVTPAMEDMICRRLSGLQSTGHSPRLNIKPMAATLLGRIEISRPDALQSALVMTLPAVDRRSPDYIPLRIATTALGGYFGSRLMSNIREEKGYTYGINAALLGQKEGGYIKIATETDNRHVDSVIAEVERELRRMATHPLSTTELNALKQFYMTSLVSQLDSPFTMMEHRITQRLAGTPEAYFEQQQQILASITPADIAHIASRYMLPDRLTVAIAGNI